LFSRDPSKPEEKKPGGTPSEGKEIPPSTPAAVNICLEEADREGRSFFRVKGAKTHVTLAGPFKLNKLTDQLDDVNDLFISSLAA